MLSIEEAILAPRQGGPRAILQQIRDQPPGLGRLLLEGLGVDLVLRVAVGHDVLLEQRRVSLYQMSGDVEDLPRAPLVEIEHDAAGGRKVLQESLEDPAVRSGPRKDRLLVVTDHEEVATLADQVLHDSVLGEVEILELVHQQVVESTPLVGPDIGALAQEPFGEGNEIVEIHQVSGAQGRLVGLEQFAVAGSEGILLQSIAPEEDEQLALSLVPNPEAAEDGALVVLVSYAKPPPEAGRLGVIAENAEAECVERTPNHLFAVAGQAAVQSGGDFLRRFVGEGHRADPGRPDAMLGDEPVNSGDEAIGLPRAGTRHHEHRAERRLDGALLLSRPGKARFNARRHRRPCSAGQPAIVSASSAMTSASERPDRFNTANEWSPPSTTCSIARAPNRAHTLRMRSRSASASRVPCRNSIGTPT